MNKDLENLKKGIDVRQSVLNLKEAVRNNDAGKTLVQMMAGDFSVLTDLLRHEDPKVRKNAAVILGELEQDAFRELLWEAYQKEKTLYVRADYLKALSHYDCTPYLSWLQARMRELDEKEISPEEEKHYYAEQTALKTVLRKTERPGKNKFVSFDKPVEIILLTNREHREVTLAQLPEVTDVRMLAGGLRFVTKNLKKVLPIRTYTELLFPIQDCALLEGSPGHIARQLMSSNLMPFLTENHVSAGPFYFRLDIKSSMPEEQRVDLVKKLAWAIEKESHGQLLNAPGGYEIELRLVANKAGRFVPLLKLFTIHDYRFAYRKESLPTSIAPTNAALVMQLAKDYLTPGAQVLDPFCGAGTMLVERKYAKKTGDMYGVDILEAAIKKARINTAYEHIHVNYINRNFFEFRHNYFFDEIVTNLPVIGRTRDQEETSLLYERFLQRIPEHLKNHGIVVVYTGQYQLFKECLLRHPEYLLHKESCINDREGSFMAVLEYRRG